jgi:hypothetical protein
MVTLNKVKNVISILIKIFIELYTEFNQYNLRVLIVFTLPIKSNRHRKATYNFHDIDLALTNFKVM